MITIVFTMILIIVTITLIIIMIIYRRSPRFQGLECLGAPDSVACGFSYPADYNQLHLHLVLPPFSSLELFDRHVFYPLKEVQLELRKRGRAPLSLRL